MRSPSVFAAPALAIGILLVLSCPPGRGALAKDFDPGTLRQILSQAPNVIRGRLVETYVRQVGNPPQTYTYTRVNVTEVLKGAIPEPRILLREAGDQRDEEPLNTEEEIVLALEKRNAEDGSYEFPANMANGRYRISWSKNGELLVHVSENGYDMEKMGQKGKSRGTNSILPIEVFRRAAQESDERVRAQGHAELPRGAVVESNRTERPLTVKTSGADRPKSGFAHSIDAASRSPWGILCGVLVGLGLVVSWGLFKRRSTR